jgi:hypothetical protein
MANTITRQVLVNGTKHYIIKVTIEGDGSGEETATRIPVSSGDAGTSGNKLLSILGSTTGFSAKLLWDATTDVLSLTLPPDREFNYDFRNEVGGLPNNAGAGITGDLVFTTSGLGAGDAGFLLIDIAKI